MRGIGAMAAAMSSHVTGVSLLHDQGVEQDHLEREERDA
jgi:hypothetical protein